MDASEIRDAIETTNGNWPEVSDILLAILERTSDKPSLAVPAFPEIGQLDLADADNFFRNDWQGEQNCEQHPQPALRRGVLLVAEVKRLRFALQSIHDYSFSVEETGKPWSDIARSHVAIAAKALAPRNPLPVASDAPSSDTRQRWEYREQSTNEEQMRLAGEAGWELVGFTFNSSGNGVRAFFKRPLLAERAKSGGGK